MIKQEMASLQLLLLMLAHLFCLASCLRVSALISVCMSSLLFPTHCLSLNLSRGDELKEILIEEKMFNQILMIFTCIQK